MESNNYIVISNELDYEKLQKNYNYIFLDCDLTSDLYFNLRRHNLNSNVYQNLLTNNTFDTLEIERKQILTGEINFNKLVIQHYQKIDLEYNYLNQYLNPFWKGGKETIVEKLAKHKIEENLLRDEEVRVSVIEYYSKASKMLEEDCMKIFETINVNQIAYTLNLHRMYKCSETLMPGEELVSKSNVYADNTYFLIPKLNGYEQEKEIFFLNISNYRYFLNNCIGKNYIVHLSQGLRDNAFVLELLSNNNIIQLKDYLQSSQKYIGQDMDSLALINLVYKYGQVKMVTTVDNVLKEKNIADGDLIFKRFCLNYKNEIANLKTNDINISSLKLQ